MFRNDKKNRIWKNVNKIRSGTVSKGDEIILHPDVEIPSLEALAEEAISNLVRAGFTVQRVSPKKANCIIRVFRHECIIFEESTYWVCGADAFIKGGLFEMISSTGELIDYSKYEIGQWLFQDDDSFIMKPHFVDYYLKIY